MDMIYLLTTDVCCYRYDHDLRARTQFIEDRRLYQSSLWTEEEAARYKAESALYEEEMDWLHAVFNEWRAKEPHKTLVELDCGAAEVLKERITGYKTAEMMNNSIHGELMKPETRALVISFFHNDQETAGRYFDASSPEDRLERKMKWLEYFMPYSKWIKTVEIPYDFTLTEEYLRDLFKEYILA